MSSKRCSAPELNHLAWQAVQERVRSFRQALGRGERPEIENYAPAGDINRKVLLVELLHEEMEVRTKAGEPFSLGSYLTRFTDLADDPDALRELLAAESELRRRSAPQARTKPDFPETVDCAAPSCIGRYELGDVIGQGAFGVVYRARDTTLNRAVALKRPRSGALDGPGAVDRFLREARSASVLRHPHIVPVYDAGQIEGQPYLVSALVEGRNLAEELAAGRPGIRQSTEWVAALAEAVDHAHQSGVIHRDMKPSNILIDREDRVFLTDFGLARSDAGGASLSIDGQLVGTPAYMAPEQVRGETGTVDARTDVYSLGVVLYELLTGTRPFQGSQRMLLVRIQDEEPTPPRRLDDTIPRDLDTVCLKAIAKSPAHRYPDAASFAAELRRYLRGEPVRARPLGPLRALWRKCRRKPVVTGLAASLAIAVVLGFAGVIWQWRRAEHQRGHALLALASGFSTLRSALELGRRDPNHPDSRRDRDLFLDSLRNSLEDQSRTYPELNTTLSSVTMVALKLLYQNAPPKEALTAHEKIRIALERLASNDPANHSVRDALARCLAGEGTMLLQMGRIEEGEARIRESLRERQLYIKLAAGRPEPASVRISFREAWLADERALASVQKGLGRTPESISCHRRALVLAEELAREQPDNRQVVSQLAMIHWDLANCIRDDRPGEAISLYQRAALDIEPMVLARPSDVALRELSGEFLFWQAVTEDRENRAQEASRDFRRAIAIFEEAVRNRPLDPDVRCILSTCYHDLGRLRVESGHPLESLDLYQSAIAHREELCRLEPESLRWRGDCAGSWSRLGEALENLGQITEAVDAYQKSVVHERLVFDHEPGDKVFDERLRQVFRLQLALGRPAEAVVVARQRKACWPDNPAVAFSVAVELFEAALVVRPGESTLARALSRERRHYAAEAFVAARDCFKILTRGSRLAAAPH
jgi:serine/threonine protein kinase